MIRQIVRFSKGRSAPCVRIDSQDELHTALHSLGLGENRPVLVLVGGAAGVESGLASPINRAALGIARAAEASGAALLDGGTRFGVMAAIGLARSQMDCHFPLLGVVLSSVVRFPSRPAVINPLRLWLMSSPLDSNHTHFILVPGHEWGDETTWIDQAASILAGGMPALTVLVNGGEISRKDVEYSLKADRPVLAVQGTGRLADELASLGQDPRIMARAVDDPDELFRTISYSLSRR